MGTNEQFWSAVRTLLQVGGTVLVTKGYLDAGTVQAVIGALMVILPTIYGLYVRRPAGLVESAAALPDVKQVVVTNDLALKVKDTDLPVKVG